MNEKTKHINGLLKDTRKILEHEAEGKAEMTLAAYQMLAGELHEYYLSLDDGTSWTAESIKENIERIFFTMGLSVALMIGDNHESN